MYIAHKYMYEYVSRYIQFGMIPISEFFLYLMYTIIQYYTFIVVIIYYVFFLLYLHENLARKNHIL